jgi:fructose-bisphosphate aldolase class I
MDAQTLEDTAKAMVAPGKGLLAIDESTGTCNQRFEKVGITTTVEKRREYRELILTAPGLGEFISGAILFDETIRQSHKDGTLLIKVAIDGGIIPGIKLDTGAKDLAGHPGEKFQRYSALAFNLLLCPCDPATRIRGVERRRG